MQNLTLEAFFRVAYFRFLRSSSGFHKLSGGAQGLGFFSPANAFWLSYVALSIILQDKDTTFFNMMIAN